MKDEFLNKMEQGGFKTYLIGFALSILLTIIPFVLVMTSSIARTIIILIIVALAVIQIIVHLICFLHLRPSSQQSWNLLAFIYTLILLVILAGASIWIMYHLNHNMM